MEMTQMSVKAQSTTLVYARIYKKRKTNRTWTSHFISMGLKLK